MSKKTLRALIVDDEAQIRQLASRALSREGFCCDLAADGNEAQRKLGCDRYDLVVMDLRMPNRHGHSLASELLLQPDRPLVVVLTALADPRMTKDLLTRGVDDVVFKPVNYPNFAAKLRGLVNRRTVGTPKDDGDSESAASGASASAETAAATAAAEQSAEPRLSMAEFDAALAKMSDLLPLSQNTLDISQLAQSKGCSAQQLAAAIQSDAALAVEILRLANSSYYNPRGSRIVELVEAIPRIGYRRIGELTLSLHAQRLLDVGTIPWMDRDLAWRRTIAAGLATDLLGTQGKHASIQRGLFLAASMHGFGRVALARLFPRQYDAMIATCQERHWSLQEQESRLFPSNHAVAMSQILQSWSVPFEIHQPLRFLLDDFSALARISEPTRSKVELVKLAVFLGWIAVGAWESWDLVEIVPASVFNRLRINDPAAILRAIREGMNSIAASSAAPPPANVDGAEPLIASVVREIRYRTLSPQPYDPYAELLDGMDLKISPPPNANPAAGAAMLVNCLDASAAQIAELRGSESGRAAILLGSGREFGEQDATNPAVRLPTSYANLRSACEQAIVT